MYEVFFFLLRVSVTFVYSKVFIWNHMYRFPLVPHFLLLKWSMCLLLAIIELYRSKQVPWDLRSAAQSMQLAVFDSGHIELGKGFIVSCRFWRWAVGCFCRPQTTFHVWKPIGSGILYVWIEHRGVLYFKMPSLWCVPLTICWLLLKQRKCTLCYCSCELQNVVQLTSRLVVCTQVFSLVLFTVTASCNLWCVTFPFGLLQLESTCKSWVHSILFCSFFETRGLPKSGGALFFSSSFFKNNFWTKFDFPCCSCNIIFWLRQQSMGAEVGLVTQCIFLSSVWPL